MAPPSDALAAEQNTNVFAHWDGSESVTGFRVTVPQGWAVQAAQAVRDGSMAATTLRVMRRGRGQYDLVATEPLYGPNQLIVGVTAGESLGYQSLEMIPLRANTPVEAWRSEWVAYVNERVVPRRNRALHLSAETEPVALRRAALPAIGMRDPYTLEFWIETVGLNEVVLSTWDGDEKRPYPLELVVDARGRLVFYRGRPGQHQSLHSGSPVADGQWHHVALVNDPFAGWTRLLVDGREADSLRVDESAGTLNTMSLVLAGRPARSGSETGRTFSGLVDELRMWDLARSPVSIRRTMRVPLAEVPEGSLYFSFDAPLPPDLLVAVPDQVIRVPSNLSFAFPVEALEASSADGIVTLTWQTKDRTTETFQVERSTDGQYFETVGAVKAEDHVSESADGSARYMYTDLPPGGQVLYYRVRQRSASESGRVSGALKLGVGGDDAAAVMIVGNSPNPFRDRTVITYDLARSQPVKLSVWDVSGTRVAVLLDEPQSEGRHEHSFAATGLPSGIYFVRLETPNGTAVHKMALTR